MPDDPRFGPSAQTPKQRAWVLRQMQAVVPGLRAPLAAGAQALCNRYVAGELSWAEVRAALDAAN